MNPYQPYPYQPYPPAPGPQASMPPAPAPQAPVSPAFAPQAPVPQAPGQAGYYAPPQPAGWYYVPAPAFALRKRRDPRLTGATKILDRMCLLVLLQSAAAMVWSFLFQGVLLAANVNLAVDPLAYQWLTAALVPLSTALPFLIYLLAGPLDVTEALRFEKVGFSTALLCVLGGLAVCLLGNYPAGIIQNFFSNFGYQPAEDVFGGYESWPLFILELLSTAVLVPVMEEFAFRGVLLTSLSLYGRGFAIFLSALVFSLVHLDFANVVFAFLAGLVFGYLYVRTGNLWVTICIHALNNAIAVIGSHGEFLFGTQYAELAGTLMMAVPLILGGIALILLAVCKREVFRLRFAPGRLMAGPPLTGGEGASAAVRAPLLWVVVAMMVFYTVTLFL